MNATWFLAVVPNLVIAVLSVTLAIRARDDSKPYQGNFSILALCVGLMALVMMFEMMVWDETTELALFYLEILLDIIILIELYIFVMKYTGMVKFLGNKALATLSGFGTVSLILAITNPWHNLFIRSMVFKDIDGFAAVEFEFGPAFSIWSAFCIVILLTVAFVLVTAYVNAAKGDRGKYVMIGLAIASSMISAVIYWFTSDHDYLLDFFTVGLFIGIMFIFFGAFKFKILEAPPITVLELLETVMDGTALLDIHGNIAYWNQKAMDALTDWSGRTLPTNVWLKDAPEYDITITKNGRTTVWNVRSTMMQTMGRGTGRVLILRDITEEEKVKSALVQANGILSLVQSVNRHDLMNDMTALAGYLELIKPESEKDKERLERAKKVLMRMSQRLERLKDISRSDNRNDWQSAKNAFLGAMRDLDIGKINVETRLEGLEVRSSSMLERIFYTFIDNTLRHGGQVGSICVGFKQDGGACVIYYQDDGAGVPEAEKERIFERGFGKNTGMGLYLSMEIARMNGMNIVENGTDGAKFELTIPEGGWRLEVRTDDLPPKQAKG